MFKASGMVKGKIVYKEADFERVGNLFHILIGQYNDKVKLRTFLKLKKDKKTTVMTCLQEIRIMNMPSITFFFFTNALKRTMCMV